jgi:hypothetical protein
LIQSRKTNDVEGHVAYWQILLQKLAI